MFTGIITDVGRVRAVIPGGDTRLEIETAFPMGEVAMGASIACSGCCLTVVEKGNDWFAATASAETMNCTTLGGWTAGRPINLERALKMGDELGGHVVSGHVDGIGTLVERHTEGDSTRMTFEVPAAIAPFIASKGSVAIDGVSLTVNEVGSVTFGVNIIPHTLAHTTLGGLEAGAPVNIEIDMLARYVARLVGKE